jgi:fanconi-associated nuclease 1
MDRFVQRSRRSKNQPQPAVASVQSKSAESCSEPPRKRPRVDEVGDSDDEDADSTPASVDEDVDEVSVVRGRIADVDVPLPDADQGPPRPERETAFESSLPAVATDKEAIEEYEAMRASQESQAFQASQNETDNPSAMIDKRQWVRGKSSIYVDAFNLALDTVLEDESNLFDAKEQRVFEQWRALDYEAQYL